MAAKKIEGGAPFFFVLWRVPGQAPRGSRTFATRRAALSYARRSRLFHPTWTGAIVRYQGGEQDVVEEVRR